MKWEIIKKAFSFSLSINLTSTKVMAWALFIFMTVYMGSVPEEGKVFFGTTMSGIIFAMYTGKNIQEAYLKSKKDDELP